MTSRVRTFLSEPLVQFLFIGVFLFAGYFHFANQGAERNDTEIVITPGRINQMTQIFMRTWQRPPSDDELQGLIDAYVKEEIFYREGLRLGIDEDDTVIRRRLQQKMEFLMEPTDGALSPTEDELQRFLTNNKNLFEVPPKFELSQIFYSSRNSEREAIEQRLADDLSSLNNGDRSAKDLGTKTLLPANVESTYLPQISSIFGRKFASTLPELPVGEWTGPVSSEFGLHLVKVLKASPAHLPTLEEIRNDVRFEWESRKRREIANENYSKLRNAYQVTIATPDGAARQNSSMSVKTQNNGGG